MKSMVRGVDSSFVREQMDSCRKLGVEFDVFNITRGGALGYAISYWRLVAKILAGKYHLVHAHYGLSALIAVLQPFTPVLVTFHGCDVNASGTRWISKIAYRFSRHAIVVEEGMLKKLNATKAITVIPCGVDTDTFHPVDKAVARKELNIPADSKCVLFASSFDIPVKNAQLAKQVIENLPGVELIELKNKTRQEVNRLLNASDLLLLTSVREGSPMIIKEALAAECPIATVAVGDVRLRADGVKNVYICPHDAAELTASVEKLLVSGGRSNGRQRIFEQGLDLDSIAGSIYTIYKKCAGLRER